jgi:hypothetical protein
LKLSKPITSTITQLRTGHGYFRAYLSNIPTSEYYNNPTCTCGAIAQTPLHLLLYCRHKRAKRQEIWEKLKGEISYWRMISNEDGTLPEIVEAFGLGSLKRMADDRNTTQEAGWGDVEEEEEEEEEEEGDEEGLDGTD